MSEIKATFLADFDKMVASSRTAEAALKSVEAGGVRVQSKFDDMGAASDRTAPKVGTLRQSLSQFDGALASVGVNIGTEIRGMNDLADASGKTAAQLGALATAGFVVAAAAAGWKIGRMAAEFFDLDKKIGNATAKLLGWGDAAGQAAGAKQDSMNLAFTRTGVVARDAAHALEINTAWLKKQQTELKAATKANEEVAAAMVELNSVGAGWQGTLDTINGSVVEAIKFYLAAGVSQGVLATAYGLTAVQVKSVASALADETEALKFVAAGEKSLADFRDIAHKRQIEILKEQASEQLKRAGIVNTAVQAELDAQVELNAAHGRDAQGRMKVTSAAETLRLGLAALHATKQIGISQTAQEQVLYKQYTDALYAASVAQDTSNSKIAQVPALANAAAGGIANLTASYWAAVDAQAALSGIPSIGRRPGEAGSEVHGSPRGAPINGGVSTFNTGAGAQGFSLSQFRLRGFGSGGPVLQDGPIYAHKGEFVLPAGGSGTTVINNFTIIDTAENLARKAADLVMKSVKQTTKLGRA